MEDVITYLLVVICVFALAICLLLVLCAYILRAGRSSRERTIRRLSAFFKEESLDKVALDLARAGDYFRYLSRISSWILVPLSVIKVLVAGLLLILGPLIGTENVLMSAVVFLAAVIELLAVLLVRLLEKLVFLAGSLVREKAVQAPR